MKAMCGRGTVIVEIKEEKGAHTTAANYVMSCKNFQRWSFSLEESKKLGVCMEF